MNHECDNRCLGEKGHHSYPYPTNECLCGKTFRGRSVFCVLHDTTTGKFKMNYYILTLKGGSKSVMVEEGLFYGQPTVRDDRLELLSKDEINRLLGNPYFNKQVLSGSLEIKLVEVKVICSPCTIKELPPPEYDRKFVLADKINTPI